MGIYALQPIRRTTPDALNMAQLRELQPDLLHAAVSAETLRLAFATSFAPSLRMARFQPQRFNKGTHLLRAVMAGDRDLVVTLLACGAPVNARDSLQNTPLHWAVLTDEAEIETILLEHGADFNQRNALQTTAERYRARTGYWSIKRVAECSDRQIPIYWDATTTDLQLVPPHQLQDHVGFAHVTRSILGYGVLYQLGTQGILRGDAADGLQRMQILDATHLTHAAPLALRHYGDVLGWGVVATRTIAADSLIGYYTGEVLELAEYTQRGILPDGNAYGLSVSTSLGEWIIDSRCADSLCGRLNHGDGGAVNAVYDRVWLDGAPAARMTARRAIGQGEEIRINYGEQYWEAMGRRPV